MIHIVLVHPKMPSNTGNIIRLCANTGASLHLVKPLGFELDDKKLRRAGLDYHEYANLKVHDNWQSLTTFLNELNFEHVVALTTKFSQPFYNYDFTVKRQEQKSLPNIALVFGSETDGLPEYIRKDIAQKNTHHNQSQIQQSNWLRLPMLPNSRSLNLSNSVAICIYEVWRQLGFHGDTGVSIGYDMPNQPNS